MQRPKLLLLHISEWESLKDRTKPPVDESPAAFANQEYLRSLKEQSQQMIDTWADSLQGYTQKRKGESKRKQQEQRALIKAYRERVRPDNKEVVRAARDHIFENTCYGRQLVSALMESQAIEEREAQITFKKQVKKEQEEYEKEQQEKGLSTEMYFGPKDNTKEMELRKRTKELAEFNQSLHKYQTETEKICKQQQIQDELEDARLTQSVIEAEQKANDNLMKRHLDALREDHLERQKIAGRRQKREVYEEKMTDIWRRYHDRVRCREKKDFITMRNERLDNLHSSNNYKTIKKILEDKDKEYEEFVQKGIRKYEKRVAKAEKAQDDAEKREKSVKYAEFNKKQEEINKILKPKVINKCVCERQTLIAEKPKQRDNNIVLSKDITLDIPVRTKSITGPKKQGVLTKANSLVDNLRRREKAPSGWTGTKAEQEHFAIKAQETLRECKYKYPVLKVVHDFRKTNHLNSTKLDLP